MSGIGAVMARLSEDEALHRLGGTAEQIAQDLEEFAETAKVLSSEHPRLVEQYPLRWVGVYRGHVAASAETLDSLMAELKDAGIPPERAIVRFVDTQERTLIL